MGHGPVHPAPPPPKWGFVGYLAILALVCFGVFALIRPAAGESFLFVIGIICFLAPLLGWAVTVSIGKWLPRLGDVVPVGALFISFCCGFTIFKEVVIDDYQPTYAREFRFNWFNVAGDGAKTSKGTARQLNDTEFAAARGIPMAVERARSHYASHPDSAAALEKQLTEDSVVVGDMLAGLAEMPGGDDYPSLSSFDARAKDAHGKWLALPANLRRELYLSLTSWRLKQALVAKKDAGLLLPQYQVAVIHDAFHALGDEYVDYRKQHLAAAVAAGKPLSEDDAKALFAPVRTQMKEVLHDKHIHLIWHDHHNDLVKFAKGETQRLTTGEEFKGFLVAFADTEQTWHNWCYSNVTDAKSPLYTDAVLNLRQADNELFQAFAVGIYIDNTTAVTIFMVTLLAFLIHLFSVGYMHGEIRYTRFMATINLFTAGMIGLVLANNFLWLFICWEIMGLCSYLLIGHYFEKKSAQEASMKAFFTTRIADTFMFIGMMMIFAATGTFVFAGGDAVNEAMHTVGHYTGAVEYGGMGSFFSVIGSKELFIGGVGATAIGLLCFIGPMGKSAQFPFHVWLPDAMEGPTPVSAMIHAACMVSAGVYLTARLFPLFTPDTLQVIALIGGFTALAAGTIGLVQTDIKKVLAYSTISQLGYMFMGIGVGAWYPAVFHMLTHAFFKALMFLGSGSVILGCHHEQEMTRMGGLWKKMPITTITFWVGNASIIGLPFFFAGYYSKEAILTDAVIFGHSSGQMLPYIFGAIGAGLTTFYMCRLMWLTFHGKPRDKKLFDHVKESPWTVVTPLIAIAIGALFISWPIGAHKDSVNLGLTNIVESHNAGPGPQEAHVPEQSGAMSDAEAKALFEVNKAAGFNVDVAIARITDLTQAPAPGDLAGLAAQWHDSHHGKVAAEISSRLAVAGVTFGHVDEAKHAGVRFTMLARGKYPAQAPNESWMAARVRKPASAYSEGFLRSEYAEYAGDKQDIGHGVERDRIDALYADGHGRPQYAGVPAWQQYDLIAQDPAKFYSHGGDAKAAAKEEKAHAALPATSDTVASAASGSAILASASVDAAGGASPAEPAAAPVSEASGHAEHDHDHAAHAGGHDDHAQGPATLDSHAVHDYHDAHHGAHMLAFIVALIMLGLGIAGSMYFYLGPLAGKDWTGHVGFRAGVKRWLRNAYYMDAFYDKTLLRGNRWLRQIFSWFDRVIVDGFVNLFGTVTRWMCRVAAMIDYWGVDGSVRGVGNATVWSGEQASRTVTGRIQDYVFLLVAGVVILFMLLVLLK